MRRPFVIAVLLVLALSLLALGGCKERTVTVRQGEVVICTAGEVISDDTEELEVPADEVASYSVTTRVVTCDRHSELGSLYEEAQRLIAAGDLAGAREKLATILERDPSYGNAQQQLADIDAGKTPGVDDKPPAGGNTGTPDATTAPGGDGEVTGPIASLLAYVPDRINGYSAQEIIVDPVMLSRVYLPVSKDADQLVITAEQTVDAATAAAALDIIKATYAGSAGTVKLNGVDGYFGTRDSFAMVAFTKGGVVVSVELHGVKGDGATLKNQVVAVATELTK